MPDAGIDRLFGQTVSFNLLNTTGVETSLSGRNRRLLAGAANFLSLSEPGASHTIEIYLAPEERAPRLTDETTLSRPKFSADRIGRWTVADSPDPTRTAPVRHVVLSADGVFTEAGSLVHRHSPYWALRSAIEKQFPMQYDRLRAVLLKRRTAKLGSYRIPRATGAEHAADFATVPAPPAGAPKAVLFGLHWLEIGGAERWAIESVKLARDAGLLPIVLTGRESYHPWITRPELDGALVLPLTFPSPEAQKGEPLLAGIFRTFDVVGVHVHHAQWLYDRLPWIRHARPELPIIDSLHIIEYGGGGYPAAATHLDNFIDIHHVISPQLERWLHHVQGVPEEKQAMRPLVGFTDGQASTSSFRPRIPGQLLRIGFVGRLVRQKRPYLFVKVVARLKRDGIPFRAILQGSGDLLQVTRRRLARNGLAEVVELRPHDYPVTQTLSELDVLVISSQNEGLTLTTLEALANGIPVLSADVGSQSTLITGPMLVSREPHQFVVGAVDVLRALSNSDALRERIWHEQFERATEFSAAQSANDWMKELFTTWRK